MAKIEDELLHSFTLDDELSFERIYRQFWSRLYVYAFNVLRERELCEDIIQEVFTGLYERRHDIGISDLDSYLRQSVRYQIFNHFRRSRYRKELLLELDLVSARSETDETFEMQELRTRIENAISKLPQQRRTIFEMSRSEGLSTREISDRLNISLQTVKNQISQALKFIRKSLNIFPVLLL